ncbi:MAG TPA: ORF6N domain-containing protein [Puia sp.]|nr:ORF6N domain-containing protein [Puia sp.]
MAEEKSAMIVSDEVVISRIYYIRGHKVMLDEDLAELYQVATGRLNEQVKRNIDRFPLDFMFQLTEEEFKNLKSQNATSSWGGRRKLPNAFTEHGVLMLSSVLNSERAIKVNIQIMRIYTKMREMLSTHTDILLKLEQLERKVEGYDEDIQLIFMHLKRLIDPPQEPRPRIGFRRQGESD